MKKVLALLLALFCLLPLAGCGGAPAPSDRTVTDMLGRTVTLPQAIERIACIGAGALRYYSYIGELDKLCGVEACEYGYLISVRPYQMLHEDVFKALPSLGSGGPQGSPDAEAILAAAPDVIFSLYTSDTSAMDELQAKTGVPVVVLSYGDTEAFDSAVTESLLLMGEVLGREERAKEVTDFIGALKDDLDRRTRDVPDSDKKTVYLGCQSNYGTHGIGSSSANYSLFDAVHAKNVLDLNGYKGYQRSVDLEAILTMDPDVIVLDAGGLANLKEEYAKRPEIFDSLRAFRDGEVYLQMPYNAYYTNLEIAFADAYFVGKTLFPAQFDDIDPAVKFDEISCALLGAPCYEQIASAMYGGYQKLNIEGVLK